MIETNNNTITREVCIHKLEDGSWKWDVYCDGQWIAGNIEDTKRDAKRVANQYQCEALETGSITPDNNIEITIGILSQSLKPLATMKQFIWIGILSLSFMACATAQQHSSTNISRDSQRWCRIGKSNDTVSYLCNQEIRVSDYSFFLYMMEKEYGKNSEKYRSLLPDTASFLSRYHFRFTYMEKCPDYMNRLQESLPMTCITYEQANAYCQWKESVSKKHHKYALHYSIPSKTDYESALKHAKITQFPPLSTLNPSKCKRTIHGLTDNVPEYLLNGDSTVCCNKKGELSFEPTASNETGIGFRFKVEKIRIK